MFDLSRRPPTAVVTILCALTMSARTVWAQETPAPAPAPAPPPSLSDSLLALVDIRSMEEIQHDVEELAVQKVAAESRMEQSKLLQARADAQIQIQKSEIESIKAEKDLAKKEGDKFKASDLDAKKKLAELEKNLLERRKSLRDREIKLWAATSQFVDAKRNAVELEMQLAQKREARSSVGNRSATPELLTEVMRLEKEIGDLERNTLEAQIAAAEKREAMAKQDAEVAKARRQIFDAQVKLVRGG